jgi:hypothetical protein
MKLIIAGSRNMFVHPEFINEVCSVSGIYGNYLIKEIVSGCAEGIDNSGEEFAFWNGNIQVKRFYADWEEYGKAAGPIRNKEMAEYADTLLLIWDGESKGSANMKKEMLALNKPVYEVILRKYNEKQDET